jgi:hypothetical protein
MYWVIGAATTVAVVLGVWFYFSLSPTTSDQTSSGGTSFGVGDDRTVTVTPSGSDDDNTNTVISTPAAQNSSKIFKVADGPVTSATLVQTYHPTTTLARYVLQENGHVMDMILDNSGVVARAVSNTTIPGTARGLWTEKGSGIVLQYLEGASVKSLYVGFPVATTTASSTKIQAVRIQFLPSDIIDIAVSPDGKNIAYLLKTASGSDGYTAKIDGTNSKKLFSTPLSQLLVSWPSQNSILLQTKSAAGMSGAAFSVAVPSGAIVPLVYAPGLTAIADQSFAHVIYQTIGGAISSYVHDVKANTNRALSFNPIPEKCVLSPTKASFMYCAAPLQYVSPSYLDQWHQGSASAPDAIFAFNIATGASTILASPGSDDGGVASDIGELSVSPDDHYLLFIKKGDRSLWALRLVQ